MCKETFLRLPEEKRTRFLDAAWEEFTHVSFAEASVNQIVRRAGVPRGSFYQYFEGKEDLFAHLQSMIWRHFVKEYGAVLEQEDGDIFRTQLHCFDRFVREGGEFADRMFERCVKILRMNAGLNLQVIAIDKVSEVMLAGVREKIDVTAFRRKETEFVEQVFLMTLMALAGAVMDSLLHPELAAERQRELETRMDIIKNGSLTGCGHENG